MKTKNKILVIVEIAIVLCSMFLVAIPAIAADQNQEMQKVSATANEVTTSSEDDSLPLGIHGNANEDDTIDMGDVVYIKLAIFGKKPKTELCDAKYDGRINVLDVIQTKLIILGKEKEITIVDYKDRIVTVKKPVERIATTSHQCAEVVQLLGAQDKVVGVRHTFKTQVRRYPVMSTKPIIGSTGGYDIEAILMVKPDIVIGGYSRLYGKLPEHIAVFDLSCTTPEPMKENVIKLGYVLDERDNADKYLEWHDRYVNEISERVSKIPDDERPRLFLEQGPVGSVGSRIGIGKGHPAHDLCVLAGGINIATGHIPKYRDTDMEYGDIETEWVLDQNPEVIIGRLMAGNIRPYELDDNTVLKAYYDEIRGLPGFEEHVEAVKNDRVYIITNDHAITPNYPSALAAMVKWFYPELFEDIDPQAIHQEYIDLKNIPFNVYEQGTFVYPPY